MTDHNAIILCIIKSHQNFADTINQHEIVNEYILMHNENITPRRVRRIIEELIKQGEPIISSPRIGEGGYCWQGDNGEALECYKRLRKKGIKILVRARRIRRNWLAEKARRGRQEQLSLLGVIKSNKDREEKGNEKEI